MLTKRVTQMGLLAAVYAALTILLAPISYGPIQVRVSEALTLLPYFLGPWAAVALWIGCIAANVFGGLGVWDITFGAGLTLVAGLLTSLSPNKYVAALPPILLNAVGIGWMLSWLFGLPYLPTMLYVGAGEAIAVGLMGLPLMTWLVRQVPGIEIRRT